MRRRLRHLIAALSGRTNAAGERERGAILILSVVGVVVAVSAAGLSVDLGRLAAERRVDQKVADMAALDAVRVLPDATAVTNAANTSALTRNGFDYTLSGNSIVARMGTVDSAGTFTQPGTTAVEVTVQSHPKNAFIAGGWTVTTRAVATLGNGAGCVLPNICVLPDGNALGTVRVGSKLASLSGSESTIMNKLLTQVVGGAYSIDVAGYQGLAAGNVEFARLRTALGVSAGRVDQLAATNFTFRQILDASVIALNQQGDSTSTVAAGKLALIAAQVGVAAGTTFNLLKLFDVAGSVGSGVDVANAGINVMDILRAGLVLADSDHFATFDLLASSNELPLLSNLVPDFVKATVKFGLIEAPQMKSGAPKDGAGTYRTIATTSQVRVQVDITENLHVLGVGGIQVPGLVGLQITTPYYMDAGTAQAKLDTMACATGSSVPASVSIFGVTQPATVNIGTVSNPALSSGGPPTPGVATLTNVQLGLLHVTVNTTSVQTTTVAGKTALLSFSPAYTQSSPSQPIPGTQIASVPTVGGSNLSVAVTGVGSLGLNAFVSTAVVNAITAAATPLMNTLFVPIMKSLGLSLGGADIWAPPPQLCNPTSYNTDPPGPGGVISLPSLTG
jgi:uncharacterized membrane protein